MYTCPMHPEIKEKDPGKCPICSMKLIKEGEKATDVRASYKPLIVIILLVSLTTYVLGVNSVFQGNFLLSNMMMDFMAGFFLVFSGFKLIDLKGFAEGYSTYDLLAKRVYSYGYIYPFIELFLGLFYATHSTSTGINIFAFIIMTFSGVGVLIKVLKKEKFQCACLGTFLKVPLTKVTLIEDFGMSLMALLMVINSVK